MWEPQQSEEGFCIGRWPAQGVRDQERLGGLPCRHWPGEECHNPGREKEVLVQGQW